MNDTRARGIEASQASLTPASDGKTRGRVLLAVRVLVSLGLLGLAIFTNRAQLEDVFRRPIDAPRFGLAFVIFSAGMFLAYLRWFLLVRALALPFRFLDALRLGLIGTLFNFVIPGAIGGDFVKAAFLCREQAQRTGPIASVVVDRLVGLIGLFILAGIAGIVGWERLDPPVRRLVTTAWIATAVVSAVLGASFLIGRKPSARRSKLRAELAAVGMSYRRHIGIVFLGIAMGAATHFCNVLAFFSVSRAIFPVVPDLAEHLLIVPLVLFCTAVPLPFGAIGVTEQISLHLFRLASYQGGGVAMMAFRILQLGGALCGLGSYLGSKSQVKALREEAGHLGDELVSEEEAEPVLP